MNRSLYLAIFLFFIGFSLLLVAWKLGNTLPVALPVPVRSSLPNARAAAVTHIRIPDRIDLAVEEMQFGSTGWGVATRGASIASISARPGETGNIIIYSHNWRRLFGPLQQVKIGDQVALATSDGATYTYTIQSRSVVDPSQIDALRPTTSEVLTLYTCTGLLDTKRLVLQATR